MASADGDNCRLLSISGHFWYIAYHCVLLLNTVFYIINPVVIYRGCYQYWIKMSTKPVGEVKTTKFQWEINIDCFKDKNVGDAIVSPRFFTENSDVSIKNEWFLTLYPKGDKNEAKDYLSLYLVCDKSITASYDVSIFNQDSDRVVFKSGEHLFIGKQGWGYAQYVKLNFIMDPKNNILKNNKLTIVCKIMTKDNIEKNEAEILNKINSLRLKHLDKFEELLTSEKYSDVTVSAEGKSFKLHKNVLTTFSVVFDAMFRNDMKEKNQNTVEIKDIKYEVLQDLFQYIYTGKVNNLKDKAHDLLTAAEKYCIDDLKLLCEEEMLNNLTKNNAVNYLLSAIMNNAEKLKANIIKWISSHLESLIEDPDFDSLGIQYPEVLLSITKKSINNV